MASATMKILYGPPGTGKTWNAAREAIKAVEPTAYAAAINGTNTDEVLRSLHENLVADGRIVWVTFHPSYSYEDFVEGYRPSINEAGQLIYKVVDGPFKEICRRALLTNDLQLGEKLLDGNQKPTMEVVEKSAAGWFIQVSTKRVDKVASTTKKFVPRAVMETLLERGFLPQIFSVAGSGLVELEKVGIDPADDDVPEPSEGETATVRKGSTIRKIIAARTGTLSSSDLSNPAHFGAVLRRLIELKAQGGQKGASVALVIDEINRAEPSRVFGELITLLEADKREGAPQERKIVLPHSKTLFSVPQNVSVIGTMNTVDRSLTALDFAMRRRFEFEFIGADPALLSKSYAGVNIKALLRRINSRIGMLLGSEYEFGHAFLMESRLNAVRDSRGWESQADGELRALAHVLRTNIMPTLIEYFHDDWDKVRAIAGEAQSGNEVISLFATTVADVAFVNRLPDGYELSESKIGNYAAWWNPNDEAAWVSDQFQKFIVALAAGT